jgi:squalene synthase HpnC
MKIINSKEDILEMLKPDGGRFSVKGLDEAYKFCEKIATSHYENFPVGSVLIPKTYRKHFFSVYVFSRLADDIADELTNETPEFRIQQLRNLLNLIKNQIDSSAQKFNPLALALCNTIYEKKLPIEPFERLIKAFEIDSEFIQPNNMDDNLEYCKYSANPVGELVLKIFDNYDNETAPLSDSICTGLQLVNFWQDISRDYKINRIYIPKDKLNLYKINDFYELNDYEIKNFDECLKDIYDFSEKFFIFGYNLVKLIKNKRLKVEIALTIEGGKRILLKTRNLNTDILVQRPVLKVTDFVVIFFNALRKTIF